MSDQTPSDPSNPPGPPPSAPPSFDAPPPPPPSAPAAGGYSAPPTYSTAGAQPVPAAGGAASLLSPMWQGPGTAPPPGWQPKQKIVAGILGILLGGFGIHSFYLGNSKKGIIQIVASVVTCGLLGLWGFIEGIMILIGNVNTDAYGVPLTE
jgi:TM2 domain-containing membrane protein YozV